MILIIVFLLTYLIIMAAFNWNTFGGSCVCQFSRFPQCYVSKMRPARWPTKKRLTSN